MTSIDDLQHDLKGVSDTVLGDLSTEERIRVFAKEAADGNEGRLEQLADTAPRKRYTATDLEYLNGIKKVGAVSLQARHELQKRYQGINEYEATRDKYMALMLLNESLSRLSHGEFDIDEFGDFDAVAHDDAEYAYDDQQAPDVAYLATKYRELWEDIPAELLVDDDNRAITRFPNLAASGLIAYPDDLSTEAFDDLDDDRISSEVYQSEVRLLHALVDFYTRFHGWRLFAEEHLDITLDELLEISAPAGEDGVRDTHRIAEIDENLCENILSLKRDYLEAYPALLEEWASDIDQDTEAVNADLDVRAQNFADGLADAVDLP